MKKYLLSYATTTNYYYNIQQKTLNSFLNFNEFDNIFTCNENSIKNEYKDKHKNIFSRTDGTFQGLRGQFFIWKPYLIYRTLNEKMNEGDILMYSDVTIEQIKPLSPVFEVLKQQSFIPFQLGPNNNDERAQTKRDTFLIMNCDEEKFYTPIFLANHMFFKKDLTSLNFVKEWLTYSEDERAITDMPNTLGLPDHDLFIKTNFGHRHDQSIFSCLVKKYLFKQKFKYFQDLTQYGNEHRDEKDPWGQLLYHGR